LDSDGSLRQDFDRIALVSTDGATHNDHYHNFLLRQLPSRFENALEIGCGTGMFAKRLAGRAHQVLALDVSPEMIRLARERSSDFTNIDFHLADICGFALPSEGFDCVASIATLHHLPFAETLSRMKLALKPGGVLLVLDLFEPEGLGDAISNLLAIPVSTTLRLIHRGRLLPPREVREAWNAHEQHDRYLTIRAVRKVCARVLPGAQIRKHLLWRYSIVWRKGAS
jgi:SAM-dependent methyltransferase